MMAHVEEFDELFTGDALEHPIPDEIAAPALCLLVINGLFTSPDEVDDVDTTTVGSSESTCFASPASSLNDDSDDE
eukprot:15808771-Heterocapsa_arctica.AAC.1